MIESAIQSENTEQFLIERFLLESELIKNRYSKNIDEKSTFSKRILNKLFMEKVLQDPYFSIYVCKRIEESDFNLNDVLAYSQYIILEIFLKKSTLFDVSSGEKTTRYSPHMEYEKDKIIDNLIDKFPTYFEITHLKYNDYYNSLQTNGNKNVLEAIEKMYARDDIQNVRWQDESPFSWNGAYGLHFERLTRYTRNSRLDNERDRSLYEREKTDVLKHLSFNDFRNQTRFLYENIKPYFRYGHNDDKAFLNIQFFAFLNFKTEFLCKLIKIFENHGFSDKHDDKDIAKFLKFYMDAALISQLSWFNSFDENHKIEILNQYYDDFNLCISDANLNLFGKDGLLHYLTYNEAIKLYHKKDYADAIYISNKVLDNTDDEILKYLCASLIADIYQEKNNYEFSLKYFEIAYVVSKKFTPDMEVAESLQKIHRKTVQRLDRFYRSKNNLHLIKYVEIINIAEMHCYLKNKDKANDYFKELNEGIHCFSIPKRIDILYHLISYCNKHQDQLISWFSHDIVELADIYNDRIVDSIEDDMKKEIFSWLELDNNLTKEKCAQKWIDNRRSAAMNHIGENATIPFDDGKYADLIKVYADYNQCLQYSTKGIDKVESILKSSILTSKIYCGYSIIPYTQEPRISISRIKDAIQNLEKIKNDEYGKFHGLELHDIIQKLKLECSRCYYALEDFDSAEAILRDILTNSKEESISFNARCLLGISLVKNWDVRSGVKELEKAIDMDYQNDLLFECCRDELFLNDKEFFFKVSDSVVDRINLNPTNKDNYKKNGYLLATWEFNEFGLTEEAKHFIEKGLSLEDNELVKISLLEEKAYISYLDGDYEISKSILEEIIQISLSKQDTSGEYSSLCSSAWHKLSLIYAKKHEFKTAAKCIDTAIDSLKKGKNQSGNIEHRIKSYCKLQKICSILSEHVIMLDKISIKEVIDIFKTSDEIIFNGLDQNYNTGFDFELACAEYGKGLETYMHDQISVHLRKYVFSKNNEPVDDDFWGGYKHKDKKNTITKFDYGLQNALHVDEKTIGLGQWKRLIDNVFHFKTKFKNNPYIEDSCEFIKKFMEYEQWDIIVEACARVSEERNGAAHYGKGSLDDALKVRGEIIKNINEVIDVLENISPSSNQIAD